MLKGRSSEEFKRDAVVQIVERGYRVAQVLKRLGVSQHSLRVEESSLRTKKLPIQHYLSLLDLSHYCIGSEGR
jgi:transposase-like protein